MAKSNDKPSISNEHLEFDEISQMLEVRIEALRKYYSQDNPEYQSEFVGYSEQEVSDELEEQLIEIDRDACLSLLAAIEARFRVDFITRVEGKKKDNNSRLFRNLSHEHQYRIPLEEGLFNAWKEMGAQKALISDLKTAFNYRHWLAHGRFWVLKAGRNFDFYIIYQLAQRVNQLPMIGV